MAVDVPRECMPRFFVAPDPADRERAARAPTKGDADRIIAASIKRARKGSIRLRASHAVVS